MPVHVYMPMCTYVHLAATLQLIAKKPGAHKDMIWSQSSLVLTHTHPSPVTLIVALLYAAHPSPPQPYTVISLGPNLDVWSHDP